MKYSFVFVFCVASLIMQCSCRPQGVPVPPIPEISSVISDASSSSTTTTTTTTAPPSSSSPAAETIMNDAETPTEVTSAGEQVVFDDAPTIGASQDDSETAGVTTDMPARSAEEMQMDDAATTITPEMTVEEIAEVIKTTSDDAPAAPSSVSSSNDDAEAGTTQSPAPSSD